MNPSSCHTDDPGIDIIDLPNLAPFPIQLAIPDKDDEDGGDPWVTYDWDNIRHDNADTIVSDLFCACIDAAEWDRDTIRSATLRDLIESSTEHWRNTRMALFVLDAIEPFSSETREQWWRLVQTGLDPFDAAAAIAAAEVQ